MNFYSLRLTILAAHAVHAASYHELARITLGRWGEGLVTGAVAFALFGSMVGFSDIMSELTVTGKFAARSAHVRARHKFTITVICHFTGHSDNCDIPQIYLNRVFILALSTLIIVLPLSMLPQIHQLEWSSGFAVSTILLLSAFIVSHSIVFLVQSGIPSDLNVKLFNVSFIGLCETFSVMAFAVGCAVQVIPVYFDLKPNLLTTKSMNRITFTSNGLTTMFYLLVGVFGYLNFGAATQGNILNSYAASNVIATIARIIIVVHVALASPLLVWPARVLFEPVILRSNRITSSKRLHFAADLAFTFCFLALAVVFAIWLPDINIVFGNHAILRFFAIDIQVTSGQLAALCSCGSFLPLLIYVL
jgi:amino acid permease